MASPTGRVVGFTLVTLLPALASLVSLPVLARALDPSAWAGLAVGQSVGAMASLVAAGGWALTGPSAVADAAAPIRRSLYEESVRQRALAALVVIPVGMLVTSVLVPDSARMLSLAVCASTSLVALSPRWLLVGAGRATDVLRFEGLPVAGAHLVAAGLIVAGGDPLIYPAAIAVAYAGAASAVTLVVRRAPRAEPWVRVSWRSRWVPTATEAVAGAYSAINVALVSAPVSAVALAGYASGWKLYQWGLVVVAGSCQALQGWVAAPEGRPQRFRTAVTIHAAVGALGLVGFVLLGGPLSSLLFGSSLRMPDDVSVWFGVAVLFLSLNSSLGRHVLVTCGRVDAVLRSTLLGAVVGVPAILILVHRHGVVGGAAGLALTEALVFAYQLTVARPLLRRRKPNPGGATGR
ncbi:polysaccharide biosynthesis C-terminal domain-containing protein [Nocardioides sp. LHD-245]|uniref:lipopolysaccharide biosynthesis protein n=1 Tax=Nocardioides sp. LHD-245 TaxID=3051387 RepID=UPI0027DFE955|nr:polysaccharide biosynthesis C-terminal domain-containing protein [Nocardioides sp. LHD-245]